MTCPSTDPQRSAGGPEAALTSYHRLREARAELFANAPGGIEVLTAPEDVRAARHAAEAASGTSEPVGVVYADRFVTVVRDAVRFPDGHLGLYVRVLPTATGPAVVVLPLLGDGCDVVLVEHYRHATRRWHLEAPRGFGENTSGEETAARELAEELGTRARSLVRLGSLHPDTGLLGSQVELFAARVDRIGPLERAEGIRRALTVSAAEAEAMIADGRLTDAFTIAALSQARLAGLLG
ncbi:NUDIX hydrolase [Streptomyces hainanensis]|uniref:NUDIX hydrolase n=1 Tax=Streptomyces hainanensis TaxID=402648 RepID=A0A4R4TLZ8_9ACTN|nr:NUDIX hydrolase [Streptomyces hainanensis]TDC79088.1 NUDIX hydrolase [Streptomyces hainanensis]